MAMRISGLMSGMDTETIISQLVEAKKTKVNKAIKAQKSLKYKQDAWKTLNTQIKKLHSNALSNLRFESSFIKKTTKVSNSNVVSVITGEGAMNSVQSLTVDKLARSGYLTGGELDSKVTGATKLSELGVTGGGEIKIEVGGETAGTFAVNEETTVSDFIQNLKNAGLTANFDEKNHRFYIASKTSGADSDFAIIANDENALKALSAVGLSYNNDKLTENYITTVYGDLSGKPGNTLTEKFNNLTENDKVALRDANIQKQQDDLLSSLKESYKKEKEKYTGLVGEKDALLTLADNIKTELVAGSTVQINSNFDYSKLNDEEKKQFDEALSKAVQTAETNGDTGKVASLKDWKANWETNRVQREVSEQNLHAMDMRLEGSSDIDNAQLTSVEKTAIENRVKNAENAFKQLDSYKKATKTDGRDAEIHLNGALYHSDKNTFDINGLTLIVNAETDPGEEVTITTQDDTDGIYDMIKNFFKEYNALINQMDKLYGADSAKEYEPLLDEEKDAMSDSEIEEWETKIKDSILRKDSTLGTLASEMKRIMMEGAEVDGKKMYLSNFGINTLSYFIAPEFEKNAYHIDGDADDGETSGNADVLKSMIANDPDTVVGFFTQLSKNLYSKMSELMGPTEYSSAMTAYDDKKMKTEYDDYTAKIKDLEKKLADYEDKWYAKFASMETALAKMQQNASAVTSLLGGGA